MSAQYLGWTTIKQAESLVKTGLDPDTADMYIPQDDNTPVVIELSLKEHHAYYPCWSLGKLISLIPDNIWNENGYDMFFHLQNNYINYDHFNKEYDCYFNDFLSAGKGIVQNVVDTMIWLLEKGYVRKYNKNETA
jgi:hypothetical protein